MLFNEVAQMQYSAFHLSSDDIIRSQRNRQGGHSMWQSGAGVFKQMSFLDQYLAIWIILAMVVGVICGYYVPHIQEKLSVVSIQGTSLPIALGLWLMMWPVLAKVMLALALHCDLRGRVLRSHTRLVL